MIEKEFSMIKKKINKIFAKKEISKKDYDDALKLIYNIKNYDSLLFEYNMGKLNFMNNRYSLAKEHLNNAIKINNEFDAAYFYLYKINVANKKFYDAYNNLLKYKDLNIDADVELFLSILKQILDLKNNKFNEYKVNKTSKFGRNEITEPIIYFSYEKIIDYYNKKQFFKMKEELNKLNKIIIEYTYPIEIDTLSKMLNQLIELYQANINNLVDENSTVDEIKSIINSNDINIEYMYPMLEKMVDKDYKKFITLIDKINIPESYEFIFLKNKAFEYKIYDKYGKNLKEKYDNFVSLGSSLCQKKEYDKALNVYMSAYKELKNKIFLYYIGKVYYKLSNYQLALKYLNQYIEEKGAIQLEKTLMYIFNSYKRIGEYKKSKITFKKLEKINISFKRKMKVYNNTKRYDNGNDFYTIRNTNSEKINNDEFNFEEYDELLNLKNFEEYNFRQKLQLIKYLYQKGNIKTAQLYLKKINASNDLEKEELNQFNKNKILYKNKHR